MMQNKESYTWREYRPTTVMCSRVPIFNNCLTTKIPSYRHHVSLYAITEEDAHLQIKLGNVKNRPVNHYSSELVIDTDNEESAELVWNELCKQDYQFEIWKLNNYKFFIQRDEKDKPSEKMCYQDRQFVRENFVGCSKVDTSIYSSPFHLIRAKNSIHEVTRAKTVLVETHKGSNQIRTNNIEIKNLPTPSLNIDINLSDWEQFQFFIGVALGKSDTNHMNIWKISKSICKFLSYDSALEVILLYAKSLGYCEEKAHRAFLQAFNSERES